MKIGMMSFAHMHANGYARSMQQLPDVELVGIFDDDLNRGEKAAKRYDTKHYIDQETFLAQEMDAVIICSENSRHKEMVIKAAKANKHILCEKPIATKVSDAKKMIQVCEEAGVILQIAYPVRFSTSMLRLKEKIDNGELGELLAFRTTNRGQNPSRWFIDKEQSGGGAVLDHTVHMVDIMRWFSEEEIVEVSAIVDSFFHNIPIDDAGILTLEFESGIIASHDASWSRFPAYPTWGDATIEVIGTKQTMKVDIYKEHLRLYAPGKKSRRHRGFARNRDLALLTDFIDTIQHDKEPFITGYDGLKSLEVALAAYESSETGQKVNL